ncbi:hypothetical protein JCM5350_001732 [Sporobolomyces pararoseus]
MPPKRKAEVEHRWAPTAVKPSDNSIKPPKEMPAMDPQLARDFKALPKERRKRTAEQRKIYTRYKAFEKRYTHWNGRKQKNIREDANDATLLHSPICTGCGEESDAWNATYGFLWSCSQCTEAKNDENPNRPDQRKKAKKLGKERAATGAQPEYKTDLITRNLPNSASPPSNATKQDWMDIDMDQPALGEISDEDAVPSKAESSKQAADPDGPVPIPQYIPRGKDDSGARDVPFPKDNPAACDRYTYIVRTMDRYGIREDWPTKFYNDNCSHCGEEGIHWTSGARVVATVHGRRLYFKYGTSKPGTKGEACLTCEKLLVIAEGIVDRNDKYEEKYSIPEAQKLSTKIPSFYERTLSAFSLILSLPDNSGKAYGSDLFNPTIDLEDKELVQRQIAKLSTLKCSISQRKIVLVTNGTRQSDKLSIDRVYSDKPYAHPEQILQATGWGMNMAMGNMKESERKEMLNCFRNPRSAIADVVTLVQDAALDPTSSTHQEPSKSTIDRLMPLLVGLGYDTEEYEARWEAGGKKTFRLQSRRQFREGRPGRVRMIGQEKVLDRMDWKGDGASIEEHLEVAKIRFVSSGGFCSVTGCKFVPPPPGRGSGYGLDGQCDRIFDDGLYNGPNTWMILGGVNYFKSTLLAFRSRANWNELLASRPDLSKMNRVVGLKLTAAYYIREELAKV